MNLDLNNPALAAVFGGICTGVIQIIATMIISFINRKTLVRDLATIMHDYLSEDINYYKDLATNYKNLSYVKFDDINVSLINSSRMSYIRNDMYLFRNRDLRKDIYGYLFKKDNLLKDIQYLQQEIHIRQDKNQYENEFDKVLANKILELQEVSKKAEELNKQLEKLYKNKK
jgi:vacuolar-type H+-ATPase subunit I/STV1